MASTIQLKRTVELASKYIYNSPLIYSNDGELAYRMGDYVRQFILAPPFAWRWNRGFYSFNTVVGQTDYTLPISDFGWLEKASIALPPYSFIVDNVLSITRASNIVTATLQSDPANLGFQGGMTFTVANVTDTSFNGSQAFVVSQISGNTMQWYQAGANNTSTGGQIMYPVSNGTGLLKTQELEIKNPLAPVTELGLPAFIGSVGDDNNGNITFRLQISPDQVYNLNLIYQRSAQTFSSLTDTWWPIPDYMIYLCDSGYLAQAYQYKGDERFAFAQQEFLRQVLAAQEGSIDAKRNIFLERQVDTARTSQSAQQNTTLGNQGRLS